MRIVREGAKQRKPEPERKPLEEDAEEVVSETLKAFKDRNQAEQQRRLEATDSEFWCALCFETRAQKEEFLSRSGLMPHGDKYLDGRLVAQKLGIVLENKGTLGPLKVKRDPDYLALSRRERR
jgi:hypothetical protein